MTAASNFAIHLTDPHWMMATLFVPQMSLDEASKLQVGDKIDFSDTMRLFYSATIIKKQSTKFKIQFDGFSKNTSSDYKQQLYRFAKHGSISSRPAHRLKNLRIGDCVDINPLRKHSDLGWTSGKIMQFIDDSGQIQVNYEYKGTTYTYWVHLDNQAEIDRENTHIQSSGKKRKIMDDDGPSKKKQKIDDIDINELCTKIKLKNSGKIILTQDLDNGF